MVLSLLPLWGMAVPPPPAELSWGSFVEAFRPDILLDQSEDPLGHVKWLPPGEHMRPTERLARASAARQNEGSDYTPT